MKPADPTLSPSSRPPAPLSEQPFLRRLWLVLAVTSPLFGVEFFRYNSPDFRLHLSIPVFVLGFILMVGALGFLRQAILQRRLFPHGVIPSLMRERILLLFVFLLVFWHLVGWIRSENAIIGRREFMKMVLDGTTVLAILAFFPRDSKFLERYWRWTIGSASLLAALLIYRYIFVFGSPYLGSNLFLWTNSAKNQFVWHIMPALVFSLFYFCRKERRPLDFLPLLILSTAWIYVASRAAWISVGFGLAVLAFSTGLKKSAPFLLWLGAAVALGVLFLEVFGPAELYYHSRMLWFLNPADSAQLQTQRSRFGLIQLGWECFQRSPWLGIGLGSTAICFLENAGRTHTATHVDYLTVLSDLGLVGLGIFLSVLVLLGIKVLRVPRGAARSFGWVSQGSWVSYPVLLISMLFANVYTTPFFWILCGLFCLEAISREADRPETERREHTHAGAAR